MPSAFHPPLRPTPRSEPPASAEPKGWMQALTQQDDALLYLTAALGVLMPGIVYIVYHKAHAAYSRYATRKEEARLAEEKAKAELAIFYTRGHRPEGEETLNCAEERAKELEDLMGEEHPKMVEIETMDPATFASFKGFGIFMVECSDDGQPLETYEWFLDWLETVAAEKRERAKLQTTHLRFAVLGMSGGGQCQRTKAAETLSKRLRILGASPVVPDRNFDKETEGYEPNDTFRVWAEDLFYAIDRWGCEEEEEEEESEEEESEEEEEDGGEEEVDTAADGVRRRHV